MMRSVVVSMCTSAFCISARSVRYTPTPINAKATLLEVRAVRMEMLLMSALGHKWTCAAHKPMSVP
jgi:hypothetical protein